MMVVTRVSGPLRLGIGALLLFLGLLSPRATAVAQPFETPLHRVSAGGDVELARLLIERGADVNAEDLLGRTPLHRAVEYPRLVRLLIENGARVNEHDIFGETPLHLAVRFPETVRLLIQGGATVNTKNAFGETPLDEALDWSLVDRANEVARMLIEAGAGAR